MKQFVIFFFTIFFGLHISSQQITATKASFGVDKANGIIVWYLSDLENFKTKNKNSKVFVFNESYTFLDDSLEALSYNSSSEIDLKGKKFKLYITKLPIIHLEIDDSKINNKEKIRGKFTYFNNDELIDASMGVRHRGNLSLSFAKKSFDLQFMEDLPSKEKKDIKFANLRSDDDWILDAMYNEPLRLRSYIAANIWSAIHQPYYEEKEPKAKSGFGVKYVEVFKNNQYYGVYQLMESVDRKQLKLKKNKGNVIRGELYKANSYAGGPSFTKAPKEYSNLLGTWNGWAFRYPYINDEPNWKNLSEFSTFAVHSSDEEFRENIPTNFRIDNAIDYYLFVNLLGATDNLGKNYYLGRYTQNEPYFFIPWDLDGVWGIIQDGKEQYNTIRISENGLLKRLLETNPDNYKERLKKRWQELRLNEFSNESLFNRIDAIYKQFTEEKIYEREDLVWQNKLNKKSKAEHYEHLKWWLEKKLINFDNHFNNL